MSPRRKESAMCRWQQLLVSILFANYFVASVVSSVSPFHAAKSAVKYLEKIPPITEDPFSEIKSFLNKVLDTVLFGKVLNGDTSTNQGRVEGPVRVLRPSISDAIFYYHYSLAGTCESSLERWECPYCKILGPHIQLVTIISNARYHTKSFIAVDHLREEIVLAFRPFYNLGNFFTGLSAKPVGLDGENQLGIKMHSGILKSTLEDYDKIVTALRHLTSFHPEYKLVLSGNSQNLIPPLRYCKYLMPHTNCTQKYWR